MTRSTSNKNCSGSSDDRRRRKVYLVEHYRADVDVLKVTRPHKLLGEASFYVEDSDVSTSRNMPCLADVLIREDDYAVALPACRCYRCGVLLTVETVTADRRVPGCKGGTYARHNIRPACAPCNSSTGGALGARRRTNPPKRKAAVS